MVTNKSLENERAYLNQIPWDQRLNVPSKGHKGNSSLQFKFLIKAKYTHKRKSLLPVGPEPGPLGLQSSALTTWPPFEHVKEENRSEHTTVYIQRPETIHSRISSRVSYLNEVYPRPHQVREKLSSSV